jgi:nucleotide-binding universal stress UspA family protein
MLRRHTTLFSNAVADFWASGIRLEASFDSYERAMNCYGKATAMSIEHILVPTDFSASSNYALDYAITFASKLQARLTVVHVVESFPLSSVEVVELPQDYLQELKMGANRTMESSLARITAAGLKGDVVVVHGTPFQEILEAAKTQHVDLIIMGTHGRTGLHHLLLGSVAERVVRLAPCPVLVVRMPAATAA